MSDTEQEDLMTGELTWFEMGVPDATRAQSFYGALLGWTFESMGEGGAVIRTAEGRAGLHPGDDARQIVTYFHVDDIEASVQQVRELGGQADDPGPAEEGFGRFVTCRDDQGVCLRAPPAELIRATTGSWTTSPDNPAHRGSRSS